ncbi:MAG: anaerobic ribonucleoside-triphosphate reductase activating protein [Fusobacterium gastrosuis]|uniref:anaerobic ribonucleoside-triphosphate reductase activating protein n=1 Tax=Fusobacterium gastrosuis TaxID=1755100 RepID=UPI002A9E955A|nr:anaerobic ribonucleoside-triphosphate reductase activating protein [Fusobacteriaceae bacterium]MDY5794669.1 anaerobic ribonucleoside-triphosphate reductase activating protein [Fusobacterium gastrosuis]
MNYSGIKYADMINGIGIRVSLFVSGCNHGCKNCFNVETWNPNYGEEFTQKQEDEIINFFKKYGQTIRGLSLLGGDPTYPQNIIPLVSFLKKFKKELPDRDIWIWSGFTWEEIIKDKNRKELIELCDILIDGKFKEELKNLNLKWRGSSNQRVIDIKKSLNSSTPILFVE